jgi:type VI secretion system secreted protein Hcp
MPIYMKYGDINGSVTSDKFKDHVELHSFSFATNRNVRFSGGHGKERTADQATVSEVQIAKLMDSSSQDLYFEALKGTPKNVKIKVVGMMDGELNEVVTYELENAILSNYHVNGGSDQPSEAMSINFTKITCSFTSRDPKLKGQPKRIQHDMAAHTF